MREQLKFEIVANALYGVIVAITLCGAAAFVLIVLASVAHGKPPQAPPVKPPPQAEVDPFQNASKEVEWVWKKTPDKPNQRDLYNFGVHVGSCQLSTGLYRRKLGPGKWSKPCKAPCQLPRAAKKPVVRAVQYAMPQMGFGGGGFGGGGFGGGMGGGCSGGG